MTNFTHAPWGPSGYVKILDQDPVFFRLGYFNYAKVNMNSLIMPTKYDNWTNVDMLFDWEN